MNASGLPDRGRIEAGQLAKLQGLLSALVPGNAFYSARLPAAGAGSGISSLEQFYDRVPFTHKQELIEDQRAHPHPQFTPDGAQVLFTANHGGLSNLYLVTWDTPQPA